MGLPASRQPASGLATASTSNWQRIGQACDAPPASRSPVASMTTTANVPDTSRR